MQLPGSAATHDHVMGQLAGLKDAMAAQELASVHPETASKMIVKGFIQKIEVRITRMA